MAKFGMLDFNKILKTGVSGKHAIGGAVVGTVGIGAVRWGLNAIKVGGLPLATKIPLALQRWTPLLASIVAAFGGYALLKKASPKNANSFAIGSVSAGAVLTVADLLKDTLPAMNDYVTYRLPGMGFVTPSPKSRLNALAGMGVLMPDTGKPHLNRLAQAAMDDYVEYDVPG
jgi:hypothetical protein